VKLSVKEVTRIFAVSENEVARWVREQNLPAMVVAGHLRFHGSDLLEWATARKMSVPPELFCNGNSEGPCGLLKVAVARGGVLPNVPGADKASVLSALVERLPFLSSAERQELGTLLRAREKGGTTAVGDGIAIPHPAHPLVVAGSEPSITLCYLHQPVDFEARDNVPVHALFVLLATNIRNHLTLLAELASALHNQQVREAVKNHAGQPAFLRAIDRLCEQPVELGRP
jgi:PTS system nitrogen regulatory IIA component